MPSACGGNFFATASLDLSGDTTEAFPLNCFWQIKKNHISSTVFSLEPKNNFSNWVQQRFALILAIPA